LFSENSYDSERVDFNFNPYYEFKSDSNRLLIDYNYINFDSQSMNTLSDAEGNTIPFVNRRYIQEGLYTIKTYRLDYTKTVSDRLSWSLGTRFADVNTDSDQQSFSKVDEGVFSVNEKESSQFLIEESIFALYSKINSSVSSRK
jgi:hypothetical protein